MKRTPLASRALRSVGYDPETETLECEFASGRIYQFTAVPRGTYEWLMRTPSKGAFLSRMINDHYPYREVTEVPAEGDSDLAEALSASLRARERQQSE